MNKELTFRIENEYIEIIKDSQNKKKIGKSYECEVYKAYMINQYMER